MSGNNNLRSLLSSQMNASGVHRPEALLPRANNGVHPHRSGPWQLSIAMAGLPLQSCSVLLTDGTERVLVDTGFSSHDAVLLQGLERAGVAPEQITAIINTHFHLDHIGCNALFPRARVYASRVDYEWGVRIYESVSGGETRREVFREFYPEVADEEFDRMDQAKLLQLIRWLWDPAMLGDLKRYRWIEDGDWPFAGLQWVSTPGHTPGHLSIAVEGQEGAYLIVGDARAFRDDSAVGYDMPPHNETQYQASRRIVDAFDGVLIPGHDDPFVQHVPAAGEASARPVSLARQGGAH